MTKHMIVDLIDRANVEDSRKEKPFRNHLGGSLIGNACDRQIWYSFRWAVAPTFDGRMLRLFARGHAEEYRFINHLKRIGANVRSADVDGKQFRIVDVDGHFGGSLDGLATNMPELDPNEEVLLEFKTHNTKSFCNLVAQGVVEAKPVHYKQMQIYMYKRQLKRALYMAVNKNDDDLYCEWVLADYAVGEELVNRARRIIYAPKPPDRISNSPGWYECKWCDYKNVCHYGEAPARHCRSCKHVQPGPEGSWQCLRWAATIPGEVIPVGCEDYSQITD